MSTSTSPRQTFTDAFLAEVRSRTPLPTLVGLSVQLRRAAALWCGCCPFHGERRPSFYVYPDHFHCFGCGAHGDAFAFLMSSRNLTFVDAVRELAYDAGMEAPGPQFDPRTRGDRPPLRTMLPPEQTAPDYSAAAQAMWLSAQPSILNTPVENYLLGRGIKIRDFGRQPGALRFHPNLWHADAKMRMPAMVAAISAPDGRHAATHRTWLEYSGGGWIKARLDNAKMSLGPFSGGSIHLWRGASRKPLRAALKGEPVVIGEGIESCLSIAQAMPEIRVLCAVSQGNLGGVELPPDIGVVILAIDNDIKATSHANAARLIARWLDRGFNVRIARSPVGNDFNDALYG